MATNIHLRAAKEDFEIAGKVEPVKVDLTAVKVRERSSQKGLLKFSMSVMYFFVLVYFLVKLLA
jgi:hypothetical protein